MTAGTGGCCAIRAKRKELASGICRKTATAESEDEMKTIDVFFDTEFTNINPHAIPGLISIGCVSVDGREFYAELTDTWNEGMCSSFVIETVLPLLDGGDRRMTVEQLAARLKEWIEGLGDDEVVLRSDARDWDWRFIQAIFDGYGWPANLCRKCEAINFENSNHLHGFKVGQMNYWKTNKAHQHHALVDARSMHFAWKYAMKGL
jgi:hypothetical protein